VSTSVGSTTTFFVGAHYEVVVTDTGTQVNKYYFAGTQRIAMRKDTTLYYLLSDHLGSTSLVTDAAGTVTSQTRYKAWGEVRYSSGTSPTDYAFTGQKSYTDSFGLMYFNARFFDPALGRFVSADTLFGFDRYQYANNNPLRYIDPSGHVSCDTEEGICKPNKNNNPLRWVLFSAEKGAPAWTEEEMDIAQQGAEDIGNAVVRQVNQINQKLAATGEALLNVPTAREAYFALFKGFVTFRKLATNNCDCYGQYHSTSMVYIYSHAKIASPNAGTQFIVHELAHVYDNINGQVPRDVLAAYQSNHDKFPDRGGDLNPETSIANYGFFGPFKSSPWQQSGEISASEEFADQFVGWTYNTWASDPYGYGQARANFMNYHMSLWIAPAFTP
jgi:RHS repeat-associated protein